jgi:hypothetical protein
VLLPQVSNREDLLLTISLFDDDTGNPVLMDGTQTVNGQAFTSSAWTVTDGAISTTSTTEITIPAYPFGNDLSSLSLTVGTGLAIEAGDPITIADEATGLNSMTGYVLSYASSTGALTVQIGCTFEFEIRRHGPHREGSGYAPFYDIGTYCGDAPIISAQLGNGNEYIDVGYIQIMIPASIFQKLRLGTYSAALTVTDSVNTRQMFVAQLPVQFGGVSRVSASPANSSYNPNIF